MTQSSTSSSQSSRPGARRFRVGVGLALATALIAGMVIAIVTLDSGSPTGRHLPRTSKNASGDEAAAIRAFENRGLGPKQGFAATYLVSYGAASSGLITQMVWIGHGDTAYRNVSPDGQQEILLTRSLISCTHTGASWSCSVAKPGTYGGNSWDTDLHGAVPWHVTMQMMNLVPTTASVKFTNRVVGPWKVQCLQTSPQAWPTTGPTLSACITSTGIPVTFSETGGAPGTNMAITLERLSLTLPPGAFTAPESTASDARPICTSDKVIATATRESGGTKPTSRRFGTPLR